MCSCCLVNEPTSEPASFESTSNKLMSERTNNHIFIKKIIIKRFESELHQVIRRERHGLVSDNNECISFVTALKCMHFVMKLPDYDARGFSLFVTLLFFLQQIFIYSYFFIVFHQF